MREWMWVVGAVYVLMGIRFLPWINQNQFTRVLSGWNSSAGTTEFKALVDWQATFGLDLVALGAVAIATASIGSPATWPAIVWVIVARELIGGVAPDAWLIRRGYANRMVYTGFIAFHLVVIVSGVRLLR